MNLITAVVTAIALLIGYLVGARKKAVAPATPVEARKESMLYSLDEILTNTAVEMIKIQMAELQPRIKATLAKVDDIPHAYEHEKVSMRQQLKAAYGEEVEGIGDLIELLLKSDRMRSFVHKAAGYRETEKQETPHEPA